MPYLKITCSVLEKHNFKAIAERLTAEINDLFFTSKAHLTREQLRERTTIHFVPYHDNEMFIAGQTPVERNKPDVTTELSDWSMSVRQQKKIAKRLTTVLAELFNVPILKIDSINPLSLIHQVYINNRFCCCLYILKNKSIRYEKI